MEYIHFLMYLSVICVGLVLFSFTRSNNVVTLPPYIVYGGFDPLTIAMRLHCNHQQNNIKLNSRENKNKTVLTYNHVLDTREPTI